MNMDLPGWSGYQRWYKVCSRAKNAHAGIQDFEASFTRALYYIAIARGSSEPPHQVNEMSGFQDYRWCIRNAWFIQAMGGTGMTFWDFKSDYWGLVTSKSYEYDPREKPQFKESFIAVMELNKIFRRLSPILGSSPPLKPSIGILILDEDSFHESGVSIPPTMKFLSLLLKHGFGAETAIINEEYLLDGRINEYKLVIAPHIKYISRSEAEGLRRYVERGGVLLMNPFCGEFDETGEPYSETPCEPLREITGVKATVDNDRELLVHLHRVHGYLQERVKAGNWLLETFTPFQANKMLLTIDRTFALDYIRNMVAEKSRYAKISSNFYDLIKGSTYWCLPAQDVTVIADTAKVIAECDGKPVIIANKYGKGLCIYLAADFEDRALELILKSALSASGLEPYAQITPDNLKEEVLVGARYSEDGYLVFLIEIGDKEHKVTLKMSRDRMGLKDKEYEITELLKERKFKITGSKPELDIELGVCDVKVFHIPVV